MMRLIIHWVLITASCAVVVMSLSRHGGAWLLVMEGPIGHLQLLTFQDHLRKEYES